MADPQWGTAEKISPETASIAIDPRIASDAEGNAIAVWLQQDNAGTYHIWARRFTRTDGWGSAERISNGAGRAIEARVAMDVTGDAIAVWSQFEREVSPSFSIYNIWAAHYTPNDGWREPEAIDGNPGSAVNPDLAINPAGIAMVVWHQYPDGTGYQNIWARKYDPIGGWDVPRAVELSQENSSQPRPAVDPAGEAIAVWVQTGDVWTGRYTSTNGWGTSEPLTTSGQATAPGVAIDGDGSALAVWSEPGCASNCSAFAARYASDSGWEDPEPINGSGSPASRIELAFDSDGLAMALWTEPAGSVRHVWNNRYSPQTGWGSAALVEQSQLSAGQPSFGFDAVGNAIGVWDLHQGDDFSVEGARFTRSGGWEVSQRIDDGAFQLQRTRVAVDPDGKATAVWEQFDGLKRSIWSNRYE